MPLDRVPIRQDVAQLYRAEALEHYQRGRTDEANLLEIEPRWTRYAYRVVLGLLAAAAVFGWFLTRVLHG